jgi:hypothetical protein
MPASPAIEGERLHRLDLVDEPVALDPDHAHPQFLKVGFRRARDLGLGGEINNRRVPVGCYSDLHVGEFDAQAAALRPRAEDRLQ